MLEARRCLWTESRLGSPPGDDRTRPGFCIVDLVKLTRRFVRFLGTGPGWLLTCLLLLMPLS